MVTRLDLVDNATFLIEQEGGNIDGQLRSDLSGLLLHGLFFDQAQYRQPQ